VAEGATTPGASACCRSQTVGALPRRRGQCERDLEADLGVRYFLRPIWASPNSTQGRIRIWVGIGGSEHERFGFGYTLVFCGSAAR